MNWICKIASSAVSEEKNWPWMFSKASFSRAEGGQARHHGEMRLALVVQLGNESNVGRRLEHVGQARNFQARVLIERAALRRGRAVSGGAPFEPAKSPSRASP